MFAYIQQLLIHQMQSSNVEWRVLAQFEFKNGEFPHFWNWEHQGSLSLSNCNLWQFWYFLNWEHLNSLFWYFLNWGYPDSFSLKNRKYVQSVVYDFWVLGSVWGQKGWNNIMEENDVWDLLNVGNIITWFSSILLFQFFGLKLSRYPQNNRLIRSTDTIPDSLIFFERMGLDRVTGFWLVLWNNMSKEIH